MTYIKEQLICITLIEVSITHLQVLYSYRRSKKRNHEQFFRIL